MSVKEKKKVQESQQIEATYELILLNDEVNTFDYVIEVLMRICKHDSIQAEQCAWLTHFKGKCGVRFGNLKEMTALCMSLLEAGLSAEVK